MEYFRKCDYCERRRDIPTMVQNMGLRGNGAEIGVREGLFAKTIALNWRLAKSLHLVDPWKELPRDEYDDPHAYQKIYFDKCRERMHPFGSNIVYHQMRSMEALEELKGKIKFDFVYIDGNHSYPYVREDIYGWFEMLTDNGVLAGHDIFSMSAPGVTQAVMEFCQDHNTIAYIVDADYDANGKKVVDPSWYIKKGEIL